MDNVTPFRGLSIQGEARVALDTEIFAEQGDVDAYVDTASDRVLECRERGRHLYRRARRGEPLVFVDVTDDGLLVRKRECECCGCAVRVEFWEAVRRGRSVRYRPVAAHTEYRRNEDGDVYTGPAGHGRMTVKQIREAMATTAMAGVQPAALKRQVLAEKARHKSAPKPTATNREDLSPQFHAG